MIDQYLRDFGAAVRSTQATPYRVDPVGDVIELFSTAHFMGHKVVIVGNGGSAAIASHTAIDLSKNAGIRAIALNDVSAITCLANDYDFEEIFAKQVEFYGQPGDVLVAVSSSGKSKNVLNAVRTAHSMSMGVVTFSGFEADNPLRKMGDLNFYVPSDRYGLVEVAHQLLLHAVIDSAHG